MQGPRGAKHTKEAPALASSCAIGRLGRQGAPIRFSLIFPWAQRHFSLSTEIAHLLLQHTSHTAVEVDTSACFSDKVTSVAFKTILPSEHPSCNPSRLHSKLHHDSVWPAFRSPSFPCQSVGEEDSEFILLGFSLNGTEESFASIINETMLQSLHTTYLPAHRDPTNRLPTKSTCSCQCSCAWCIFLTAALRGLAP